MCLNHCSVQFSSVPQLCRTLCDPMNCSVPGLPVHHQLPEFTQTPTISSSVFPFSSLLQSFPASGSFPVSQFFTSGSQRIGVSASASVLPVNIQDWSSLGWTGWISYSPRDSQESSPTPQFKSINSSALSFLYSPTHVHRAGDAIQPSHPLSSPSPPSFNLSQHQSLVKWVSSSH